MTAHFRTALDNSARGSGERPHVLDPNGDVLFVLVNPNSPFAPWDHYTDAELQGLDSCRPDSQAYRVDGVPAKLKPVSWTSVSKKQNKKDKKKKKKEKEQEISQEPESSQQSTSATTNGLGMDESPLVAVEANQTPVAADLPIVSNGLDNSQAFEAGTNPPISPCEQTQTQSPASAVPVVEFVVSSRHLILSSHYFRAQLSGQWAEVSVHSKDGFRHIEAQSWDADALLILMQIFHAQTKDIPRIVDLEMLAKIAVLVDYYNCYNAVEFFSTLWIDTLKKQLPSQCNRELVLWLLVAVVFRRDDIFQAITKTAVTESKGPLPTLGLPIPASLIDTIDWRRQDAIAGILATLETLRSSLCRGSAGCDFSCSSTLFGALSKNMVMYNLRDPIPCAPFLGYGIAALEKVVKDFQTPRWGQSDNHMSVLGKCELSDMCAKLLGEGLDQAKKGFTLSELGLLRP